VLVRDLELAREVVLDRLGLNAVCGRASGIA
jgi:hypothetical protein